MATGIKLIPLGGISTDIGNDLMKKEMARFVKNLYYQLTDNAAAITPGGTQSGVLKPLQANAVYCPIDLPKGINTSIGTYPCRQTAELYVWVHNSLGDHTIFRINGDKRSCTIVKTDPCFNFQLDPKYFIHESAAWVEVVTLIDPATGATLIKKDLYWTDGINPQGYIRTDDCIDTNGFDAATFNYFVGDYDRCATLRMGLPTPKDCIQVKEVPVQYDALGTSTVLFGSGTPNDIIISAVAGGNPFPVSIASGDLITFNPGTPIATTYTVDSAVQGNFPPFGQVVFIITQEPTVPTPFGFQVTAQLSRRVGNLSNNLLFNTWQFRITETDVFGRPSIYGIISDAYIPGVNDCMSVSANLSNCLDLIFKAPNPFINTVEIAWRNCNDDSWKTEITLFLYKGSNIGKWWLRERNPAINYNATAGTITYRFCRDKECDPIDPATTNILAPALPKTCQSLFPLNKILANANNKDGFNPFPQDLLNKITATIIPPPQTNDLRNITIYVSIGQMTQQVEKRDDKYYYGGQVNGGLAVDLVEAKKQFFKNPEQSGFLGYLVNGQSAISTQVYIDGAGNLIDDPNFNGYNLSPTHRTLQKFVFNNVPKGQYIFAIASQTVDPSQGDDYRITSTPMWGLIPFDAVNDYALDFLNRETYPACELFIDCCAGDYNTLNDNKILIIADMAFPFLFSQCGYIRETKDADIRWELLKFPNVDGNVSCLKTDRNGFYWQYRVGDTAGADLHLQYITYRQCERRTLSFGNPHLSNADMEFVDFYNQDATTPNLIYDCDFVQIKGRLILTGTNIGVSGAFVALTRGSRGQSITDANGYYTIIAHDDAAAGDGIRHDKLIVCAGACTYYDADGNCIPVTDITIQPCTGGAADCTQRAIILNTFQLSYTQQHGLLSGGTYPWFVNGYDWLGRKTYSQPLGDLKIPSITQTKAIAPCQIQVNIDPAATFPADMAYITFSIGEESTIEKYITWIVDRAELINNKGEIDNISPSKIKIYYQSIVEFNKVNNYNTTTAWQIIPQNANTPVTSDKVQFFINGDGVFYPNDTPYLVKYDQSGVFFTIDFVSDLRTLKPDALMRLVRPKTCTGSELNYEVCKVVDIVNQKATENTFILNAFDTYYPSRQIPVPAPVAPVPQVSQIATISTDDPNITTYTIPVPVSTILELKNFGFRFEHSCPSNFWGMGADGKGCYNQGRPNAKNPYEAELVHQDQIAFGGAISDNGQLNYLQYFLVENKHSFNIANTGGIMYVCPKQGILLIITQFNNFTVGYGDTLARIDANGNVVAPSGSNTFGNPNIQVNGNYGCQVWDKNTIRERDGLVHFLDSSRVAILQHDFKDCQDISSNKTNPNRTSTILSWLAKKINFVREFNNNVANVNKKFFLSVINPVNNEYIFSDFTIKGTDYVNNERDYAIATQETIAFDIKADVWKGMYSSTPEQWGYLESELSGNQLFAFKNGVPYFYYSATNTVYNTFFGVKCNRVFKFVINAEIMKKLKPLWMEVYCKQSGYFADDITTETGQKSRILIGDPNNPYWKPGEFMFSGAFMRDLNTLPDPNNPQANANPLIDGQVLYGTWIEVRMIGYPDKDDAYSALEGIQAFVIGEANTGIR